MTHTYDDEQVAMNGIYPSTPEKETPTPKTVEEVAREINNGLASMLTPSNEAMSACRWVKKEIEKALTAQNQAADERLREVINENTSDGYHTFKELYEFRLLYNAALFNEWAAQEKFDVHKSQRHNDGELCFGRDDYFIVVATLPTGQISNHYPMSDWELFKCKAVEKAKAQWDGHTSQDVARRLREHLIAKHGITNL